MNLKREIQRTTLPIDEVIGELLGVLRAGSNAVLVAPPGAGKTTVVPLALLGADWLDGQRILVLEPRRLAARAAAQRMAQLLGEQVGETVGVRARLASNIGSRTRIEVITEGVFTRMIVERLRGDAAIVAPLYGAMEMKAQDLAIKPAGPGKRKIVLASAIAETSLTIEGVSVVIDSGLARVARYDAGARVTRLETVRLSRASADQRRGRAGRTGSGVCYRLWHEPETQGLRSFELPQIQSTDLSGLLLDCAAWGVTQPGQLRWLDTPPEGGLAAARQILVQLGAIDDRGRITNRGEALRAMAMPPHLATMVIDALASGQGRPAAELSAILVERGIGGRTNDLDERLRRFRRDQGPRARQMHALARRWAKAALMNAGCQRTVAREKSTAGLLAAAFPDRIAKRRGVDGRYLMSGGREARLDPGDGLNGNEFLVVAELQGKAAASRILSAAALAEGELEEICAARILETEVIEFDLAARAVRARRVRRLGAIVLKQDAIGMQRDDVTAQELARGIAQELGIQQLPWSKAQLQLMARVGFLRQTNAEFPDLSYDVLARDWQSWLAPYLMGKTSLSEISAGDLAPALDMLVGWDVRRAVDDKAPTHFVAPTGNRFAIDYDGELAPMVSVRVQELYGLRDHPRIADNHVALTLNLLSPAQRPIQVTRDLPGFWSGSWREVKAEMRGRYPKHVWPDDPANAAPTSRVKPRR